MAALRDSISKKTNGEIYMQAKEEQKFTGFLAKKSALCEKGEYAKRRKIFTTASLLD
jgi:hypothetical protein